MAVPTARSGMTAEGTRDAQGSIIDIEPFLVPKTGKCFRNPSNRQEADLQMAREGIEALVSIVRNNFPGSLKSNALGMLALLEELQAQVGAIDPNHLPPSTEIKLFSSKMRLIGNGLTLLLRQHHLVQLANAINEGTLK